MDWVIENPLTSVNSMAQKKRKRKSKSKKYGSTNNPPTHMQNSPGMHTVSRIASLLGVDNLASQASLLPESPQTSKQTTPQRIPTKKMTRTKKMIPKKKLTPKRKKNYVFSV